jgi:transposase
VFLKYKKLSVQTLDNYKDDIVNYFVDRQTSSFVEGLNIVAQILSGAY